jgi:hypothetical protein
LLFFIICGTFGIHQKLVYYFSCKWNASELRLSFFNSHFMVAIVLFVYFSQTFFLLLFFFLFFYFLSFFGCSLNKIGIEFVFALFFLLFLRWFYLLNYLLCFNFFLKRFENRFYLLSMSLSFLLACWLLWTSLSFLVSWIPSFLLTARI